MASTQPDHAAPPTRAQLSRLSPFPRRKTVRLDLSGLTLDFKDLPPDLAARLRSRYHPFASSTESDAPAALRVQVLDAAREQFLAPREEDRSYRLAAIPEDGGLRMVAHGFAGWFALPSGEGVLALGAGSFDPRERALENYLRACVAWLALDRGGFLLHSASIVREDGRAFLFFGASGAGKSTLAAMNDEGRVVSDDLTLLLPDSVGRLEVIGTPFRGTYTEGEPVVGRYTLHSAYRLRQDPRTFVARTSAAVAFAELLANLTFVVDQVDRVPGLADRLQSRLLSFPTYDLHLRKEPGFWRAIEEFHAANE
jgi:hypothetical protein